MPSRRFEERNHEETEMKWGGNMPPHCGILCQDFSATGFHQAWYLPAGRERLWPMLQSDAAAVRRLADHASRTCGHDPLAVRRRTNHAGRALLRDRPFAVRPLANHAARAVLRRLNLAAIRPLSDGAGRTVPRRIDPVAVGRLAASAGRALLHHATAAPAIPGQACRAAMAVAPGLPIPAGRRRRRRRGERQALVPDTAGADRTHRVDERHRRRRAQLGRQVVGPEALVVGGLRVLWWADRVDDARIVVDLAVERLRIIGVAREP